MNQVSTATPLRPLLVLMAGYAMIMMHFVLGRALRDSLLGGHLQVSRLPTLTLYGTAVAICLSVALPLVMRWEQRIHIIRAFYFLNGLVEVGLAFAAIHHHFVYQAYYIEVSASTAIGVSLMWVLIGDWASNHPLEKAAVIPRIMILGSAASVIAGFFLVRFTPTASFKGGCITLAILNTAVAGTLLLFRDPHTAPVNGVGTLISNAGRHWAHNLVRSLSVVTVLAAATSTLLDLLFRVSVADHYPTGSARLRFLGVFQGVLSLCAVFSQILVRRLASTRWGARAMRIHPALVALGSCLAAVAPVFGVLALLRVSEYSLRNSFFRFGSEMSYAALPDKLRVEVRPVIDVVGERSGDAIAAGLLQMLLWSDAHLSVRAALLILGLCAGCLWVGCSRLLERCKPELEVSGLSDARPSHVSLNGVAREGAILT